jgi:5-methylcytosine-specific restriction endonuclease McrA
MFDLMMAHRFPAETIETVINGFIDSNQHLYIKTQTITYDGTVWWTSKIKVQKQRRRDKIQNGSIRQNSLAETFCEIKDIAMWNTVCFLCGRQK